MDQLDIQQTSEQEKPLRGAIIILYKNTDKDCLFLIVENAKTGNISFVSGAEEIEDDDSLEKTAQREIREELGISSDLYKLEQTDVYHEFVFDSKKVERAGKRASYQVFLMNANPLQQTIKYTQELKEVKWMTREEVFASLTFPDLKELFKKATCAIPLFSESMPKKSETILFQGKIIEVVSQEQPDGRKFEIARRSPGIRLIITDGERILITKEWRHEQNDFDYRLPGGKVFDTLDEYSEKLGSHEDLLPYAEAAAGKECREETGLLIQSIKYLSTSKAGATIEWDLYYFIVDRFTENSAGQELEHGENITTEWKTLDETQTMCLDGSIKEDRTVGILLRYLLQNS